MTSCEHWDCGFCYAPYYLKTSAINGACNNPYKCPTFRESVPVQYETTMTDKELIEIEIAYFQEQIKVKQKKLSFLEEIEKKKQSQTLYGLIEDWWSDVFTTSEEMEVCIDNLVNSIQEWLPKEQSAVGSQNTYVECTVEGYNDCLTKIKQKLR